MFRFLICLICIPFFPACELLTDSLSDKEKAEISKEAKAVLEAYFVDIAQKGLNAEFAYLDSTDEFFWVPPGYRSAITYDSVATIIKLHAQDFSSVQNTWTNLNVYPLTTKLVNYTGLIESKMTDNSGKTSVITLIETGILKKRDGGWKILSGQTSQVSN
jgi:hypothetical protein